MASRAPILVPLDGSRIAEFAVPLALAMARAYEAPLEFLHVIDEAAVTADEDDVEKSRASFRDYVERLLAGLESGPGTNFTTDVVAGRPADAILDRSASATMVVMGSHGRGGFRATFIGSVTDKVVRGAEVPVLVAPGTAAFPGRLQTFLVALDGSEAAEAGLAQARDIAARFGAAIALVRAYPLMQPVGAEYAFYPSSTADLVEAVEQEARDYLAGVAQPGERQFVVAGNAASAIVEVADQIDAHLVVMTSRGKGLAARLVLGSTTDRVLHSLQRPLLIIRPPKEN
jgi:nucleotide-binding universal stress UspA family protein